MTLNENPDEPAVDREEMEEFRNRAYDAMREIEVLIHLGRMNGFLDAEEQHELWDMVDRLDELQREK